ncbi:protein of unknown function [Blastococcus saxobsidens DD2]|uniref:Uncharacterized protein n=1 Tax=Blastococcus saxobsidens (strain DD2) TaxID=1146883 RepID=H6RP57_BLASD|nr:protein of unknown function [Blastococcus saxobsidens DD2]
MPVAPVDDVQVTDHWMPYVAVTCPSGWRIDECGYR